MQKVSGNDDQETGAESVVGLLQAMNQHFIEIITDMSSSLCNEEIQKSVLHQEKIKKHSSEFMECAQVIKSALVNAQFRSEHPAQETAQQVSREIEQLQTDLQRKDLLLNKYQQKIQEWENQMNQHKLTEERKN